MLREGGASTSFYLIDGNKKERVDALPPQGMTVFVTNKTSNYSQVNISNVRRAMT